MAEQTTSSIDIEAAPADVMAVIADFEAYPQWAKGVRTADVVSSYESGDAMGRAEQVFFELDVSPIKDEYTLAYEWDADRTSPGPSSRARCCGRWTVPTSCASVPAG